MIDNLKNYNRTVDDYFPLGRDVSGEVGIEVEVEGRNLPRALSSYWTVHADGSLRGESCEYVLTEPIKRSNVLPYLKYLNSRLKESTIHDSVRTSVHVHVNMQHRTILQVYLILLVYFILEDLLVSLAGENRIGNLFCLRAKDAEYLLSVLERSAKMDQYQSFTDENRLRYASVNVCALWKFNSLEFRALKGTVDPVVISDWVSLLLELIDNTLTSYKIPQEIIQDFSTLGARRFLNKILPTFEERLIERTPRIDHLLWDGLRLVQGIAFATDWEYSEYKLVSRTFPDKKRTQRAPPLNIRLRNPVPPPQQPPVDFPMPVWNINPEQANRILGNIDLEERERTQRMQERMRRQEENFIEANRLLNEQPQIQIVDEAADIDEEVFEEDRDEGEN